MGAGALGDHSAADGASLTTCASQGHAPTQLGRAKDYPAKGKQLDRPIAP